LRETPGEYLEGEEAGVSPEDEPPFE